MFLIIASGCATVGKRPSEPHYRADLRAKIIQTALSLAGKPYKKSAKGPNSFDCSGFVYYVFKKFHVILPPATEKLKKVGQEIPAENLLPADIVLFKTRVTRKVFHVGIMINEKEFIHASASRGVAIDRIDSYYWKKISRHYRDVL